LTIVMIDMSLAPQGGVAGSDLRTLQRYY